MSDTEFEQASSGASLTYPKQCSALRKNEYVMLKKKPCKIVEMSTSKTGKHGHAKVHLVGLDIFEQKKYEDICPSTHNMEVPNVSRQEHMCMDMDDDGYLNLMDDKSAATRDDLSVKDDQLRKDIKKFLDEEGECLVTVLKAMGEEKIMSVKKATNKN